MTSHQFLLSDSISSFPPEIEEGNIEYKLCLTREDKVDKLATQMKWRINEGKNKQGIPKAYYYIGICDNGTFGSMSLKSVEDSIAILEKAVVKCDAEITSVQIIPMNGFFYAIIEIKSFHDKNIIDDIKVAVIGPFDSGKSTLIGTLTYGQLDDGNGSSRHNIFKYSHEIDSGETSSISYEIMGFSDDKNINYSLKMINSWEDLMKKSNKIVSFIDLPGKNRYLKTTYFGLTACSPDYIMVVININKFYIKVFNEYEYLCTKLNIPHIFVLTHSDKIDLQQKEKIISSIMKHNINNTKVIPISCVNGENIKLLKNLLRSYKNIPVSDNKCDGSVFMINEVMHIQDVGIVLSGIMLEGSLNIGDRLLIGSINGAFHKIAVESIHIKQIPCKKITNKTSGTIVIKIESDLDQKKINKNMMVVTINKISSFSNKFNLIICSKIDIKTNQTMTMFCKNTAEQISILSFTDEDRLKTLKCVFTSQNTTKYIQNNEKVILKLNNEIHNKINKNIIVGVILK